ncbi:SLC13 family permease [Haladaptatus cibarius]|uniref:SLC13 family permease n=1 Tax=Haladaptatus cibarius TaxID=453847 RepID=UPI0009FE4EA0|nr:SLC13 family permease [Haladaptatus cibarius]
MVVVFAIATAAFVLFATEAFPPDITALIVMVVLIVLGPWTGISPEEDISGFVNDATIIVLAMLVLSGGVSQTGAVQQLGERMASFAGTDERKQLAATLAFAEDFMTPIGYQTKLLVYGPGGYKFTDYFRVGAPLQLVLSIATAFGIAVIWGV